LSESLKSRKHTMLRLRLKSTLVASAMTKAQWTAPVKYTHVLSAAPVRKETP
jgi:hypothetical protein